MRAIFAFIAIACLVLYLAPGAVSWEFQSELGPNESENSVITDHWDEDPPCRYFYEARLYSQITGTPTCVFKVLDGAGIPSMTIEVEDPDPNQGYLFYRKLEFDAWNHLAVHEVRGGVTGTAYFHSIYPVAGL